jgi:2-hydroxychromene-2-carboxylate isomerase
MGYAEIHRQRQSVSTYFGASSTYGYFFWKNKNLNFWWYFEDPQAYVLWADFGKIWQFWKEFASLAMAQSLSKASL